MVSSLIIVGAVRPPCAQAATSAARQQAAALDALRRGYQRAALGARAASGLAVASLGEDRFGVLQLTHPSLGDVLMCMLTTLAAAQQFARQAGAAAGGSGGAAWAAAAPWRGTGDAAYGRRQDDSAVHALRDVLSTSIYAVVGAFGEGAATALASAQAAPVYGTPAEAERLLRAFLKGEQ